MDPLFVGMDTHALSEAAFASALEVFAANNVTMMFQKGLRYTPTPVISHAILTHNRDSACLLPVPMMNILNGGAHADNSVDFQEY